VYKIKTRTFMRVFIILVYSFESTLGVLGVLVEYLGGEIRVCYV
jgi:hypothetical protein